MSVSQVDLSVYLSDCLIHSPMSYSRLHIKKDIKRPMLSQIMRLQDMPAVNSSYCKVGAVQDIFQIGKLKMILCGKMLYRHTVGVQKFETTR